jgi:hypothetical protein
MKNELYDLAKYIYDRYVRDKADSDEENLRKSAKYAKFLTSRFKKHGFVAGTSWINDGFLIECLIRKDGTIMCHANLFKHLADNFGLLVSDAYNYASIEEYKKIFE